jgi:hypothetical protein
MQYAGLSAYHQRHVTRGVPGLFLQAIDDARIPAGSVLVVGGLDSLSRAEPIQAQAQLAQIINAGITVVIASDGRKYNREGLKAQPMDLVYSLLCHDPCPRGIRYQKQKGASSDSSAVPGLDGRHVARTRAQRQRFALAPLSWPSL